MSVDVLNNSNAVLASDVTSGTDLDSLGITAGTIKLRGNLSTTNTSVTPSLHDWSVGWTEPVIFNESGWSNVESSTQDPGIPEVTVALSPSSVTEDGAANLVYTFSRTGPTAAALSVDFSVGGSATEGTDYDAVGTTANFGIGDSTANVTVV